MWFLDCYCYGAACGRDFPVNSYFHESLLAVVACAKNVLDSKQAGIDEVRISKETKGQLAIPIRCFLEKDEQK
jgi:hypothetical protein